MWFLHRRKAKSSVEEAQKALLEAQQARLQVVKRSPEVAQVSDTLKELQQDHFAKQMEAIILRKEGRVK